MSDDAELLRQFADEGSQTAFAELVRRHLNLVYSAALRRTSGDAARASDISQEVFVQLARRARSLATHPALGAWLYTATRNAAFNAMMSEKRRKDRERAAAAVSADPAGPNWEPIRPVLDGAIDDLSVSDRTAVVLRFLERKPFAEIAAALHVTEDAARMRTDRALDKLRLDLQRRGITSTAAALELLLTAESAVAAPAGLAASIVPIAGAASASGLFTFIAALMTPKLLLTGLVIAAAAFWAGTRVHHVLTAAVSTPAPRVVNDTAMTASLRSENERLRAELALARRAPAAPTTTASAPAQTAPSTADSDRRQRIHFEQERRVMGNLRQLAAACDQYYKENQHAPISFDEIVGEGPGKLIRRLIPVNGESYAILPLGPHQVLSVTMKDGTPVTYDPAGTLTTQIPVPTIDLVQVAKGLGIDPASLQHAWDAYLGAHQQAMPKTPLELVPYFATVEQAAAYSEALERHPRGSKY